MFIGTPYYPPVTDSTLGQVIRNARQAANLSLRDVERATKGKISNGHLSLLEADSIQQPSPHHLFLLAGALKLDYPNLMRLAGYVMPGKAAKPAVAERNRVAVDTSDFTEAELHELVGFAAYIRSKRRK
jgi:transcriptional regulator with XRE-family HTH domain